MTNLIETFKELLLNIVAFCEIASEIKLRSYQEAPAKAITDSVMEQKGLTFVVIFPRQSGKNELQAQIETFILARLSPLDSAEIVKISPTWKPQSLNAMRRLERTLKRNMITRAVGWKKEQGYIYKVREARIYFLSGEPSANIVGATASILLECDEAQDVQIAKYDKEINPMAASTNATKVFWGTAWTSQTLLAREKRAAMKAEKEDGIKRVFQIDANDVSAEVPAYKKFVAGEIAKLGRNHPFVRTQYFSEEIDAEGGMFPPGRIAIMKGTHAWQPQPDPNKIYAFLIDVAGEDEGATLDPGAALENAARDATALTIVEVDPTHDTGPRYSTVLRRLWIGTPHTHIHGTVVALSDLWNPRYVVVDSTGVGAGLCSFLTKSLGAHVVIPFLFTSKSKSDLGWSFLAIIETGRYKEHSPMSALGQGDLQELFWLQCQHTQMEILPGPGRMMRWSVPDGSRDPATGELLHDDLVISAALCAALEEMPWGVAKSEIIQPSDPLDDLEF